MGRRSLAITSGFVATAVIASVAVGAGSSAARPQAYGYCPPAKHLIGSGTKWHHHRLAPGIMLSETHVGSGPRRLKVNVVRAHLGKRRVRVRPLHHSLTTRRPLSHLAHRRDLVAATNGMYFSFAYGAPTVPFISKDALVLSRHHAMVAGIGTNGRAQDGHAWLTGHVKSVNGRHQLRAINDVTPPHGLSLYTPAWGRAKVPVSLLARSRTLRHGRVGRSGIHRRVPSNGELLVATTAASISWLQSLPRHSRAATSYHVKTDANHPFSEAYGVGTQVVTSAHHVRSGLYCRKDEMLAARTDFAWSDHGKRLILATVESPRGSENYGVDENQMSQVMVRLGAARSYALDGGGSTELVARLDGGHKLSIRTKGHGERERRIPIGVGVYSLPKSQVTKHHKHSHHQHHKRHKKPARHKRHHKPKHKGLLGGLPPLP